MHQNIIMQKRLSRMKRKHAFMTKCILKIDDENSKNNCSMTRSLFFWFFFIDKTTLNIYKKNVFMWSIYVIIENLNNHCRRNQIRSFFVFLSEIFIVKIDKKHSNKIKSQIYHTTIKKARTIFQKIVSWVKIRLIRYKRRREIRASSSEFNLVTKTANFILK